MVFHKQISHDRYLACEGACVKDRDINQKVKKYQIHSFTHENIWEHKPRMANAERAETSVEAVNNFESNSCS